MLGPLIDILLNKHLSYFYDAGTKYVMWGAEDWYLNKYIRMPLNGCHMYQMSVFEHHIVWQVDVALAAKG